MGCLRAGSRAPQRCHRRRSALLGEIQSGARGGYRHWLHLVRPGEDGTAAPPQSKPMNRRVLLLPIVAGIAFAAAFFTRRSMAPLPVAAPVVVAGPREEE